MPHTGSSVCAEDRHDELCSARFHWIIKLICLDFLEIVCCNWISVRVRRGQVLVPLNHCQVTHYGCNVECSKINQLAHKHTCTPHWNTSVWIKLQSMPQHAGVTTIVHKQFRISHADKSNSYPPHFMNQDWWCTVQCSDRLCSHKN